MLFPTQAEVIRTDTFIKHQLDVISSLFFFFFLCIIVDLSKAGRQKNPQIIQPQHGGYQPELVEIARLLS